MLFLSAKRIPVEVADLLEDKVRLWNANAAFPLTAYVDDCIFSDFYNRNCEETRKIRQGKEKKNRIYNKQNSKIDEDATSRNWEIYCIDANERESKNALLDRDYWLPKKNRDIQSET